MGILNKLFGIPEVASAHGAVVDHMLEFVHWFMLILFVGWSIFFFTCLFKFNRKANPKANYYGVRSHASSHIEIGVVIVEAVLLLGFAYPLWGRRVDDFPGNDPSVVRVRAVGEKFFWNFHYTGADGKFGRVDHDIMTSSNRLGIDPADPNGKDDIATNNELILPLNRQVVIEVGSKDVIHNLALVPMRIAQDATPGVTAHMWFEPTVVGEWDIVCGQLCGPGHANMKATLKVLSQADYDKWLKDSAPAPAAPAAAVPAPGAAAAVEAAKPAATPAAPAAVK